MDRRRFIVRSAEALATIGLGGSEVAKRLESQHGEQASVNSIAGEREMAPLTVTGFAEHVLAGNLRQAGSFSLTKMTRRTSLKKLRRSQYLGYRFGYRRQFALISASYAKLQVAMGLAGSLITLNYAYLS
jgi:hypothetical protein